MKRVLVIQTAFLGDAILGTALLERIHADHPDAQIDYLVRKGNESLFNGHPFLHSVFTLDKGKKYSELLRLLKVIRRKHYDAVFNAQRFASSGFLTAFSNATIKVGYASNPLSLLFTQRVAHRLGAAFPTVHEVDRLLDLYVVEGKSERTLPKLYPSVEDEQTAHSYTARPFVTIAPASVWFTKQWPDAKWAELMRQIPQDMVIHLIGGPNDMALCQRIMDASGREASILCGKLSLLQTAALMRKAVMNYANDSAPIHLASSVNAPICAVYCSTVPEFGFTPLSANSRIIQTAEKLDCRPCGLHGHRACPKGHFKCASAIQSNQLVDFMSLV